MGPGSMGRPPMGGFGGRPPMGPPPDRHRNSKEGHGPFGDPKNFPPGGHMPPRDEFAEQDFDLKQMEKESEEMVQMNTLNKDNASFAKTSGGDLSLTFQTVQYENVQLIETFPFTEPYSFISVRHPQNKNKEIGLIENLDNDFDASTVKIIKEHLDLRYHMPQIEKILQVKESGGYTHFTVMTNYGETQFSLRSNGTYITPLTDTRLIIQDLENNRFEIPDKMKLSAKDLKTLDVFM